MEKTLLGREQATLRRPLQPQALRGSVLLVDDDLCLLSGLAHGFARRGATAITAQSGAEAMRIWRRHARELTAVVLDLQMPGMDGEDLYARLRHAAPKLALVVHSAEHRRGFEIAVASDPRAMFVRKPCRLADLVLALNLLQGS